jgi:hypothetical protein
MVEDEDDPRIEAMRTTIAFYGSTPAYRPVLEHHGWGALGDELYTLSKRGEWQNMGTLIDDDVLHTFAVVGDARSVGTEILARYGDMIDRIQLGVDKNDHDLGILIETLRAKAPAA